MDDVCEDSLLVRYQWRGFLCSGAEVTDDGQYLVLTVCEGCDPVNRLYYCDLSQLPNGINGKKNMYMHACTR